MTALKIGLKVDTFLQGICLIILFIGLVTQCYDGDENLMMYAFVALGAVQILSACIFSLTLDDSKRRRHLMYSMMYFALFPIVLSIGHSLAFKIGELFEMGYVFSYRFIGLYWVGVPIFLGLKYFRFTIRDMTKVNTLHRSFWDI